MPSPPSDSAYSRRTARDPGPGSGGAMPPGGSHGTWISREVQAMAAAWSRGERVSADELLASNPGIGEEAAIRLIYEEVCLRRESGQDVATTEVVNRFPRWKDELEVLLGCDRMLRPFSRTALVPEPGERLGPFQLLAELGRGASGKTYLAAEPALGNRLVVLKVLSDDQEEHLSLARLQHTHIIPLFSEQSFPERGLRALCMPYLGGTSLARIIDGVAPVPASERLGRHVLDVLDRVRSAHTSLGTGDGPYRRYLGQASYVQAICWIGACLADALHSAHTHGLIHMDVKPSNVLIAHDGLPMLLDFHLAHRPIERGDQVVDRLGGTPGWMAPEHRRAVDAVGHGEAIAEPVDGRADVFALGLLLREALAGPGVVQGVAGRDPWRNRNPRVSVALADLVDKCLAIRPADRYHNAAALADDLRRHLNELPLRGVANRSLAERWRKWRRRRPAALTRGFAWIAIGAAIVTVLVVVQALYGQRTREIQTALHDGRVLRLSGRFPEAVQTLGRGLELARAVPGVLKLRRSLDEQLIMARRGRKAAALHRLADLVRFRHGIDLPVADEAHALIGNIQAIWQERERLLGQGVKAFDPQSEQAIRTDMLDLAIVSAELRIGLASAAEADVARRDALELLDLASALCGPGPRLDRLRETVGARPPPDLAAKHDQVNLSVLDHYDLGRSDLRAGRFREAALEFQRVLAERPQDFWPNFYEGLCAYRLKQFHEAEAAFRACIALAPGSAECYFNRGRAAEALGRDDQALRDYSRALELDPALTSAAINRGILAYKNDRHDAAIADFHEALRWTSASRARGLIHYNLALAHLAKGDRELALASARESLTRGHEPAQALIDRLRRLP